MAQIFGYARSAIANSLDIDDQLERLTQAGCTEFFIDGGQSGNKRGVSLQKALTLLTAGDELKTCSVDRLSRVEPATIFKKFADNGVAVEILNCPEFAKYAGMHANVEELCESNDCENMET